MSLTLLAAKLHRPRPTSTLVVRPRLTHRLDRGMQQGHSLTLVVAPAGYGKTTLVSHWLSDAGIPSTWLRLEEGDNEPVRFFTYLVAALHKLEPQSGQSLLDALRTLSPSAEALAYPLINDLASLTRPILLVLDDYHLITDAQIHGTLELLLEHAPSNLHLVILTRVDPPFPLSRWRVRGQITELRADDLRFTPEEMTALLNSQHGLNLPAEQITALALRTEGWAAGVQLAALSLQGCDPEYTAQFVQAFSGSHHYVIDYLADEVLRRQPEDVQSFLLRTSILDRLCGSLCDAILGGQAHSDRLLVELERKGLFLIPLDEERHWYRYHHLFADLLFQRLIQMQSEGLPELYLRAAAWLEQNGHLESAVDYALRARDYTLAARLIGQVKLQLWNRGDALLLAGWLKTMPQELLRAQPELTLAFAMSMILGGYFEVAEEWIRIAEIYFAQMPASDPYVVQKHNRIALYRAVLARYRGDFAASIALSQQGLDESPSMAIRDRAAALLFLGHAHFYAGNAAAAERSLSDSMQFSLTSGHMSAYANASHHLAQLYVLRGNLRQARSIYEQAVQVVQAQDTAVLAGVEHTGLGDLDREWNDLEAARPRVRKGIELAEASDHITVLTDAYLARVRLAMTAKDWEAAWSYLHRAEQVVRRSATNQELTLLQAWQARVHLAQGSLAQARSWAESQTADGSGPYGPQREAELLTLARVWLADGKPEQAASLLQRIRTAAEEAGRHGRALEALMLQALAAQETGRLAQALEGLTRALAQAEPEGYVRLFVDEGEAMARLLQCALARGIEPAYANRLLAAFAEEGILPTRDEAPRTDILTERELEVLRLMADGCSSKEIADKLVIAIGTAKRHTANIFDRLDVRNRTEAVARARRLGLL